jgi:Pentapeptide repeats (8 copies)
MAKKEHAAPIQKSLDEWNAWRLKHPNLRPDLESADLHALTLRGAKLARTNLEYANLSGADLTGADLGGSELFGANLEGATLDDAQLGEATLDGAFLSGASLRGANLQGASAYGTQMVGVDLTGATLICTYLEDAKLTGATLADANLRKAVLRSTDLTGATLVRCNVYGTACWDNKLARSTQQDLCVSPDGTPAVTVDNIELAQFVYLLLNNENLRTVIDTITSKAVLILGRFTPERKAVLDTIRNELRGRNYLPIMFDFEKAQTRDFTETIKTLAGMCHFVIVDITNPKSAPLEIQATVPDYMIPFVPIIQKSEDPFSMFADIWIKYKQWVLDPLEYASIGDLISVLDEAIIQPAEQRHAELVLAKAQQMAIRRTSDYRRRETRPRQRRQR